MALGALLLCVSDFNVGPTTTIKGKAVKIGQTPAPRTRASARSCFRQDLIYDHATLGRCASYACMFTPALRNTPGLNETALNVPMPVIGVEFARWVSTPFPPLLCTICAFLHFLLFLAARTVLIVFR